MSKYTFFLLLLMLAGRVVAEDALVLWGYLIGALMHLALDIRFNGELTPRSITAFYSFTYRAWHRFRADELLALPGDLVVPAGFWSAFFRGATLPRTLRRSAPVTEPVSEEPRAVERLVASNPR